MIISILAALMLQTTVVPAQCVLNGSSPTPCTVIVKQDANILGMGFDIQGTAIYFSGRYINKEESSVELFQMEDGQPVPVEGACLRKDGMVGCTMILGTERYTIVAKVD